MARLQFCDYHNMVAILEKGEHNIDFHPIVDFVEASPLRYALTIKPTVYVSHIRQFWSNARIETTKEGTKILTTVDGVLRTVIESSLRRNLKLKDEEGISSLPDAYTSPMNTGFNEFSSNIATALVCLATNRVYNFSKMIFDGMVKNVNNKGEGSGTPTKPHYTLSPGAQLTSSTTPSSPTLPSITTAPIPTVTLSDTPPLRQYTRRTRIAQFLVLPPAADEPASPLRDVSQSEACSTDFGFGADQDRANIAKTSTLPYDSAPRVTSPAADEGSMQQTLDKLTALCTSLQRQHSKMVAKFEAQELEIHRLKARVKLLKDREGVVVERSRDDAPIKGRNLDEGEASVERVSDDTEEMATVLTSMDAATVDVVPIAGLIFATATVVTPYTRRKVKETMVESETPKKKKVQEQIDAQVPRELEEQMARKDQRMSEQIARDAEIVRIYAEEELHIMIDGLDRSNETLAKYLQEYHQFATEFPLKRRIELISDLTRYQDNYTKVHKFQTQQRKPWSKKQKRDYYMAVNKSNLGSKEEAERFKRKGIRFEQESAKRLKTSEEVPEEKVKEMMQLFPIKEVYVEALQVKQPIIDWKNMMHAPVEWRLYDTCRVHHVTSKDKEIFMLVEKDYPLRKGLAIVMICYKLQVENYSQMANDLILKNHKITNILSQQDD
nr:hypothetical protein [Tanacetum cinerariifolium]